MRSSIDVLRTAVDGVRQRLCRTLAPGDAYAVGIVLIAGRALEARKLAPIFGASAEWPRILAAVRRALPRLTIEGELPAPDSSTLHEATRTLAEASADAFRAPEALGWAHQLWYASHKERVFDAVRKESGRKVEAGDLIAATQLYTDRHWVDFLLQNALGSRWIDAHPNSSLVKRLGFRVPRASRNRVEPTHAADLRVIDPACGTGHFLVAAMDLLFAMHADEGVRSAEAAMETILDESLHGLDIDADAARVADSVLTMRAAELAPGFTPRATGVVATTRGMGEPKTELEAHLRKHPEDAPNQACLEATYAALARADTMGALLPLPDGARAESDRAKNRALDRYAATSRDARRAVSALRSHYDAVLMNPPYAGFRTLSPELRSLVARDPLAKLDLYVAFLSRGFAMLRDEGALAAITPASWATSAGTEALRRAMLLRGGPSIWVALGQRVFPTAPLLFTALSVIERRPSAPNDTLTTMEIPSGGGRDALLAAIATGGRRWPRSIVTSLEGAPFAPSAPLELLERASEWPATGDFFTSVDGVWTGDNERDVREHWELASNEEGWVPASGGQGYARWYAAPTRLIRREVAEAWPGKPQRCRGLAVEYARVAGRKLSARLVTPESAAIAGVVTLVPRTDTPSARVFEALAIFNGRVGTAWLRTLTSGLNFNPGYAARIPLAKRAPELERDITAIVELLRTASINDPFAMVFEPRKLEAPLEEGLSVQAHAIADGELACASRVLELEATIESAVHDAFDLRVETRAELELSLGAPAATPQSTGPSRALSADDDAIIRAPFPAQSDLEALAQDLGRTPAELLGATDSPIALRVRALREARAKRVAEDIVLVAALRCFGHRFRSERGASEPLCAAIELGDGLGSLVELVRERLHRIDSTGRFEDEFLALSGESLEAYLAGSFMVRHVRASFRRPILWQLASRSPRRRASAFSCIVHAHAAPRALAEVRSLAERRMALKDGAERAEIESFLGDLERIEARGFSPRETTACVRYEPQVDDGIRVNVAPFVRARLTVKLPIPLDEAESAIENRARWRAAKTSLRGE